MKTSTYLPTIIAALLALALSACGPTVTVEEGAATFDAPRAEDHGALELPGTGGAGGSDASTGAAGEGGAAPVDGIHCASAEHCAYFAACRAFACTAGVCVFSEPLDDVVTCGSTMCESDADCTASECSATTCDAGVCTFHDSGSADPLCDAIPPASVEWAALNR